MSRGFGKLIKKGANNNQNEGDEHMISYDRMWETMRRKGITQYRLIDKHHVSPGQITRMKRNESVSTHTIEMFCKILDCKVEDVMEYIPDEKREKE